MTREEFMRKWGPNLFPLFIYHDVASDLDALLSATRKASLEEAIKIAELHDCFHRLCDCGGEIVEAIIALIDQPPPPARGESTG